MFSVDTHDPRSVVAESEAMRSVVETALRIAENDVPVLLLGESGTGKEVVAQLIHGASRRAGRPFVRYNCAALPATLAESELFGYAKGAFTGAYQDRPGIFSEAHGGTLLLDEVGELPLEVQAKLLRILQTGEMQTLGARREGSPRSNVRVLCATNRDIEAAAHAGDFRVDLLYRLSVVVLHLPPLREHREDIPALARRFARLYGHKFGVGDVELTEGLVQRLLEPEWPGNVRELENAVARMVVLSMHKVLDEADWERALSTALPSTRSRKISPPPPRGAVPAELASGQSLRERIEGIEREILAETLARYGGNQSRTAHSLNISRVTLAAKIRKYGLSVAPEGAEGGERGDAPQGPLSETKSGRILINPRGR